MRRKDFFLKFLTIIGVVLVWLPILAPAIFSAIKLLENRRFLFDYLMPAEMFPLVLIGGGLLTFTALFKRLYRKLTIGSYATAIGSLILGQAAAEVTGLASGEIEPTGWQRTLVTLSIVIYILAVIGIGIGGLLLVRNGFSSLSTKNTI